MLRAYTTRAEIINFLQNNKGMWFSSKQIAESINRESGRLACQLDSAAYVMREIYCDRVIIKRRQKRLFYGWFERLEDAIDAPPPVKSYSSRLTINRSKREST